MALALAQALPLALAQAQVLAQVWGSPTHMANALGLVPGMLPVIMSTLLRPRAPTRW